VRIPIFPLNAVLFPDGPLPLRIFESRYIDMVSERMKSDEPFGILLMRADHDVSQSSTYKVGTLAKITDFYQGSDGLLGITAKGGQRFRLISSERQKNGLNVGEIELIEAERSFALPSEFEFLPKMLANVLEEFGRLYEAQDNRYDDAVWVSYRFLEILPIDLRQKQTSLEDSDTIARLNLVVEQLDSVRGPASH
jgi:Lon protease-like protein